jgi:hypothetical protein
MQTFPTELALPPAEDLPEHRGLLGCHIHSAHQTVRLRIDALDGDSLFQCGEGVGMAALILQNNRRARPGISLLSGGQVEGFLKGF